jgi:hypothetical protein
MARPRVYGAKAWKYWRDTYKEFRATAAVLEAATKRGDHQLRPQLDVRYGALQRALQHLEGQTELPGSLESGLIEVSSYHALVDAVAFLSVMNKTLSPLLRGQHRDWPTSASIHRQVYTVTLEGGERANIEPRGDVEHYFSQLQGMQSTVYNVLQRHGLPRWRHMKHQPAATWAVIQHYELWPTPLVDFTTSLRVAATFAMCFYPKSQEGFLHLYGVPGLIGDLMTHTGPELAVRLNSVCPPSALRPHLQEGVLIGRGDLEPTIPATPVARLHLDNSRGDIWHDEDFPILKRGALLPPQDSLGSELQRSFHYGRDIGNRCTVTPR